MSVDYLERINKNIYSSIEGTFRSKWTIIDKIGSGGQGTVYKIIEQISVDEQTILTNFFNDLKILDSGDIFNSLETILTFLHSSLKKRSASCIKALKILNNSEYSRDFSLARPRIKNELNALRTVNHKNIINIIEFDSDSNWFIADYYPNGTLKENALEYRGDALKTLKKIRPLVEALSTLHENGIIHRDIKPANIFLDKDNNFILGDLGLIHFQNEEKTRISHTYSNVGTHDWMPGWAYGKRLEAVKGNFDVFSLGKIIWSLISGIPILPLWYYDKKGNNLVELFPNKPEMKIVNDLLKNCVVEEEDKCFYNSTVLLSEVDETIAKITAKYEELDLKKNRICNVCRIGEYENKFHGSGVNPYGIKIHPDYCAIIYICNHCGHIQHFIYKDELPKAWK